MLTAPAAAPRRGLSLVELMVGVTVGMVVAGGALTLFARNLGGSRQLLLETRLNQDLRAAADLVTRDLRRAGYWGNAILGTKAIGATAVTAQNPYRTVATPSGSEIAYEFSQGTENDTLDAGENFGFRLDNGALQMQSTTGTWTSLTDNTAVTITAFAITPTVTTLDLGYLCPKACGAGTPNCPTVTVRSYAVLLRGQSVKDSSVVRSLRSNVRLRNDALAGQCPV
ncbi:MAG: prepilin-type N-terminal cleavage/methylation domain-containing protein [Burkholderiales bacterium]|nr:prepilin-type N-terminal cleavage/methylation domain-containing protein [Burkholderiales bacterium]